MATTPLPADPWARRRGDGSRRIQSDHLFKAMSIPNPKSIETCNVKRQSIFFLHHTSLAGIVLHSISEDVRLLENGQIPELFEIYAEESHFELIVSILDAAKGVPFAINALNPICVAPPEFPAEIHPEIPPDIPHEILADIPASIVGGFDQLTTEEAEVREADIFDNEDKVNLDLNLRGLQPLIMVLPFEHTCSSTKLHKGKMATQGWCADRLSDWIKKNPSKGPTDARKKLEERYEIKLKYSKAWSAARCYTEDRFQWHLKHIWDVRPDAIEYLEKHHSRIWYRCGFSELSKCDYLTNNVSESFNNQIKGLNGLLIHELVDSIREIVMVKFALRRDCASKMDDGILPGVMKELNIATSNLKVVKVARSDHGFAEVTMVESDNST
ncbi:hypothetical protein OsJ_24270 [Oryza sativa Japonica Group]|uniref:Uncharacterized protein n=1 Tax=Oryza sativa subsp. japonica TaxID=39947 RepID=B9FX94_ORYSJ|nr:hypothetical protein OsJ_24270 [Oryza sativa Japonica Group]